MAAAVVVREILLLHLPLPVVVVAVAVVMKVFQQLEQTEIRQQLLHHKEITVEMVLILAQVLLEEEAAVQELLAEMQVQILVELVAMVQHHQLVAHQ